MAKLKTPRWGWALTGSGHFFKECLRMAGDLDDVDLFVSKAAGEVVRMYRQEFKLPKTARIFKDTTASAAPVGLFYYGVYHTLVLAPATSNTVAKCVYGISDNLATNVFAQAGKCRVHAIVFATGHLARARLEKVLASIGETPYEWSVFDVGVKVAALMTEAIITRRL